jgi:hypothetical protein
VRGDLRRACTSHALLGEMLLDLLTARTRGLKVFPRVAPDLRLAALARLDLVTVLLQAQRQLRAIDRRRVLLRAV